jgi:hypothetical protein
VLDGDYGIAKRTMEQGVEQRLREAEGRRLARLVMAPGQRPVSERVRWLACELGYQLVSLGARLEEYSAVQTSGLEVTENG